MGRNRNPESYFITASFDMIAHVQPSPIRSNWIGLVRVRTDPHQHQLPLGTNNQHKPTNIISSSHTHRRHFQNCTWQPQIEDSIEFQICHLTSADSQGMRFRFQSKWKRHSENATKNQSRRRYSSLPEEKLRKCVQSWWKDTRKKKRLHTTVRPASSQLNGKCQRPRRSRRQAWPQ